MRYLITISYDGSKYYGFQRLNNENSIQKSIEKALSKINKSDVNIKGAGRTDRGVHAYGQCCHFDLDMYIPPKRLKNAINSLLDKYIYVIDCKCVDNTFHARFNVKQKVYKYIINLGEYDVLKEDYLYNYCYNLDIKKMKKAGKYLLGKHSYKAFVSGYRDNYNSEIYCVKILKKRNYLYITFIGKSFYRYMVRNMVGALILVGKNKITVKEFASMIDSNTVSYTYMTVPANGLYLESIKY